MGQRWLIAPGVACVILFGGCGGASHKTSTTSSAAPHSTSPAASAPPAGIRGRLLTNNELPSFTSAGITVYRTLHSWLAGSRLPPGQQKAETATLMRDGFREAAREDLTNGSAPGLSLVERFRSPSAARDALGFELSQLKSSANSSAGTYTPFSVGGIPGAVGFTLGGPNGSGINIAFSDASYYYLVGQIGGGSQAIAELTGAAQHLYHRVHG